MKSKFVVGTYVTQDPCEKEFGLVLAATECWVIYEQWYTCEEWAVDCYDVQPMEWWQWVQAMITDGQISVRTDRKRLCII